MHEILLIGKTKTKVCGWCEKIVFKHELECPTCYPDIDDDLYWPEDYDDRDYVEPPLYPDHYLRALSERELQNEWSRQCGIHDRAVDRCEEINSPTIETAQARLNMIETEQRSRGVRHGPGPEPTMESTIALNVSEFMEREKK